MPLAHRLLRAIALLVAVLSTGLLFGCATPHNDDSEIPWGRPESWDGSPGIPGCNPGS